MRHVDASAVIRFAPESALAGDQELHVGVGDYRDGGLRRCRDRSDKQIGDDGRYVVRKLEAHVACRVRAGNRASGAEHVEYLRRDVVRPSSPGLKCDVLPVHLHADAPHLRHCVSAINDRPERRFSNVDVVLAVRQPDVDLALVVSDDVLERIAVEVRHHRADVEVGPPRRHRDAVEQSV